MQIRAAVLALIRDSDLIHYLNFRGAIVAARDQVELGLDSSSGPFGARRWLRLSLPVGIHIAGLTIFSGHFNPQGFAGHQQNSPQNNARL